MQKVINCLFTIAFALACFDMWFLLCSAESIYPPGWSQKGRLTHLVQFLHTNKSLILLLPLPCFLYSAYIILKKQPTVEMNLLYAAVLAVFWGILFYSIILAVLFPLIPVVN